MFNSTFNNIQAWSCRLVLLVEETGMSGENRRPAGGYWQTLSHNVVSSTPRLEWNAISPLWIVRVLEKNCRMRCQNLIALLKACTSSGLSIYLSRDIYFTIGGLYFQTVLTMGYLLFSCYWWHISRCNNNIFKKDILSTSTPVFFGPSKQTGIIILNWSIEIHYILCYPSSCIPLHTIIYAMH
jgi:hypothetical protein